MTGQIVKKKIACLAWFQIDKNPYPISFKFQDDNGEIQTVRDINIYDTIIDNKRFNPQNEYKCRAIVNDIIKEFKIMYNVDQQQWLMEYKIN